MAREYLVTTEPKMTPVHPGEILREDVLPALTMSVSEAARQLRISRQTLHRVLAGTQSITPEMALRIGKFCGNGPGLWLRMQQHYDLWHAERRMAKELKRITVQREPAEERAPHSPRRKSA
jgi:addiction module HigA family antidote